MSLPVPNFSPAHAFPRLEPRLHTAFDGIPYFDEVLQVPQSKAHSATVVALAPILQLVADELGLEFLSDEPIWYLNLESIEQRTFYGDCVFAKTPDRLRVTAEELLLVIEIVSTNDPRKALKDVVFQRRLNEFNRVPEFALVYPDLEDSNALAWCRLDGDTYQEHLIAPGGHVTSTTVPGLAFHVRPRDQWTRGHKLDVYLDGQLRPPLAAERARAQEATARAQEATARADREAAARLEAEAQLAALQAQLDLLQRKG